MRSVLNSEHAKCEKGAVEYQSPHVKNGLAFERLAWTLWCWECRLLDLKFGVQQASLPSQTWHHQHLSIAASPAFRQHHFCAKGIGWGRGRGREYFVVKTSID